MPFPIQEIRQILTIKANRIRMAKFLSKVIKTIHCDCDTFAVNFFNMKLHRNLVFATIDSLQMIFSEKKPADKVLKSTLKRDKRWGSRDRSFIAETTYDIVRWKRLYAEIAEVKEPFDRTNLFRLFTVWATLKGIKLPDWKQLEDTPVRRIKGRFDELSKIRKYLQNIQFNESIRSSFY